MIRSRFGVYWILFLFSSLCLAGLAATFVFKELVRFRKQADMSVMAQFVQTEAQLASLVDEVKTEASRQLVSFHSEGLRFQLNKWVNENPLIREAIVWSKEDDLSAIGEDTEEAVLSAVLRSLPQYPWKTVWDESGSLSRADELEDDSIQSLEPIQVGRTDKDQSFGYLSENAGILEYERIETDPYISWMSLDIDDNLYWVCWHQLAQDAVVRAFLLNLEVLSEQAEKVVTNFVASDIDVRLRFESGKSEVGSFIRDESLGPEFPGWFLMVALNELGKKQESIILISGILVIGLFVLLIAGGSALIFKAHAGYQDLLQKTTFVSAVSHELKTPLTSIRMYAELIGNEEMDSTKRVQYADTINRESQRLTSLINNLLTFSSLEHGKRKYRSRTLDLVPLVELTLQDYEQTIRASGFEFDLELPEKPVEINFDESVIKLVLINLIENVLKHAKEGKWLGVRVSNKEGSAGIDVRDRGPGIEPGVKKSIFEPFVQGSSRLNNKKPGTGLGLSIARSMMRECGGDIVVLNEETGGATFRIKFS